MLEDFYLEGDAYHYQRVARDGKPDWDLAVIAGPRGAVGFALDLAYAPDPQEKVFKFGPAREATLAFPLPAYLRDPAEVLRVSADGVATLNFTKTANGVQIVGECGPENVFGFAPRARLAKDLEARRRELVADEESFHFDPAGKPEDLEQLRRMLDP